MNQHSVLRAALCVAAVLLAHALAAGDYALVVSGTVRDRTSGKKLENVTVTLAGTSVGTVTNADGFFSLKIPRQEGVPVLQFSHLGYINTAFSAVPQDGAESMSVTVRMLASATLLDEAVVYGSANALHIVQEAIERIPENYPAGGDLLNTFYRETVQKGRRYISVSEAVTDLYKTPYGRRSADHDLVRISRARRLLSQKLSDTLGVKMMDGPGMSVWLDPVKNPDVLFDLPTLLYYDFRMEPSAMIDDRMQYVISFEPRVVLDYALFRGRIYIDCERFAITRAEFSLDLSDRDKAVNAVLRRKPAGLRFIPQGIDFLVTYRRQPDGRYCLNYMCNEMRFRCDWRKRLFASSYTARCEMVVVDGRECSDRPIAVREAFRRGQIFYDLVEEYWDEDFWKDYNIIEPTESLENAVRRLRK